MAGAASKVLASIIVPLMILLAFSPPASAHSPTFPHGNTSLTNAWEVHDPAKSWAVYADLGAGEVNYYRMEFQAGDRILLMLIIPVDEGKTGFLPRMALLGPGLQSEGDVPPYVVAPSGYGMMGMSSRLPDAPSFEPFSPSGFYEISSYDGQANQTGTYYVAVWNDDPSEGGRYGFPVGFLESFTLEEMITIPISLVQVYNWTGQSYLQIFLPVLVLLLVGALSLWKSDQAARFGLSRHLVYWAGILIVGTGAATAAQLAWTLLDTPIDVTVSVTLLLITAQLAIGVLLARRSWSRNDGLSLADEAVIVLLALVALFTWGGYIIGPSMAIIGAVTSKWGWFRK